VKYAKPQISPPLSRAVQRYSGNEIYFLQSLDDSLQMSSSDLLTIVERCNEPLIYKYLFQDYFNGKPYTLEDARVFVEWAQLGWREHRYFVFLIKDPGRKIVGYVELSSDILTETAIGYWITSAVSGVMTNMLSCLVDIARAAGYRKLSALVEPGNVRSTKLLERLHFIHTSSPIERLTFQGKPIGKRKTFHRYEKKLISG
jgi:RimJ/RimL family protein N-acetyltransferase